MENAYSSSSERVFCRELEQQDQVVVEKEQDVDRLIQRIQRNIIGNGEYFDSPFGKRQLTYADFTASGKSLHFIEQYITKEVLPMYANTHTTTSITGHQSTCFRHEARQIIAQAVNAKITGRGAEDCVLFTGSGSTGAISKLIMALGLNAPVKEDTSRAVVFLGPFEHHSNILPWRESSAQVVMIPETPDKQIDVQRLGELLMVYADRPLKIGSFSAASNITGVRPDVDTITSILHKHGALSFWDYAAAAPYVNIDMNPVVSDERRPFVYKDAVFISGHKFIGGPSTPGVLIAKKWLLGKPVPTQPGGGTVFYVTENDHRYLSNKAEREEGGTPDVIGSVRLGLAFQLKQRVGTKVIEEREVQNTRYVMSELGKNQQIVILGSRDETSLPIVSLMIRHAGRFLHYNFVCALLNDLFGIQTRGGCQCAGPYAQRLLGLSAEDSLSIEQSLLLKKELLRPGFTRLSFPYFLSTQDVSYMVKCIDFIASHGWKFLPLYQFNHKTGEWKHPSRFTKFPNRKWLSHFDFASETEMSREIEIDERETYLEKAFELLEDSNSWKNSTSGAAELMYSDSLRWFALSSDSITNSTTSICIQPHRYLTSTATAPPSQVVSCCPAPVAVPESEMIESGRVVNEKYPLRTGEEKVLESLHTENACAMMKEKTSKAQLFPKPPAKIMKYVGQAITQWNMIEDGDRLMLGLSGGKDSLTLLHVLLALQKRAPVKFEIAAATVDPQTESFDPSPLKEYMATLGVPYFYLEENIIERAACEMEGDSLCSYCSRMKRGMLYTCCRKEGYNKLVLAQHLDDLAESFMMSAIYNGQLRTMKAIYWNNEKDIQVIRPFVYVREDLTKKFAYEARLPVINENCPACFEEPKERQRVKKMLFQEETICPNMYNSLRTAMIPLMDDAIYPQLNSVRDTIQQKKAFYHHRKLKN